MANNFIVFRMEKLKSATALRSSLRHAMREINTPNADPSLRGNNHYWKLNNGNLLGGNTVDDCMALYKDKLPENFRKNAVHCIEYVVSGSPEHMATLSRQQQIAFFQDAVQFLANKTGGIGNILHAQVHYDEITPHLTLFMIPLDEKGVLNSRKFVGGSKNVLKTFQTEIAKEVGVKYGFRRGEERVKPRQHIEVKQFYSVMSKIQKEISSTKNEADKIERISQLIKDITYLDATDEEISEAAKTLSSNGREGVEEQLKLADEIMAKLEENLESNRALGGVGNVPVQKAKDVFSETLNEILRAKLTPYNNIANKALQKAESEKKALRKKEDELIAREKALELKSKNLESIEINKLKSALKEQKDNEDALNSQVSEIFAGFDRNDVWYRIQTKDISKTILSWFEGLKQKIEDLTARVNGLNNALETAKNERDNLQKNIADPNFIKARYKTVIEEERKNDELQKKQSEEQARVHQSYDAQRAGRRMGP